MNDEEKEASHAIESFRYGDPLNVLIREEGGTCAGCVRAASIQGINYCTKGKPYGRRCALYVERQGLARAT